jgi:hypothetical protein
VSPWEAGISASAWNRVGAGASRPRSVREGELAVAIDEAPHRILSRNALGLVPSLQAASKTLAVQG